MSWLLVILFLSFTFCSVSEASHDKKLPSAVVVGTVYCDTCFQHDFSMGSHSISGASVAIECKDGNSKPRFSKEVKTDEHGEFKVQLPFSASKHVKRIKGCTVKLISSSEPYCAVASAATSSSLRLKSRNQGQHIFSAGFFSFKPLKEPNLCNQKPSIQNRKKLDDSVKKVFLPNIDPLFPPSIQDPSTPRVVPPLPTLPGLPPLPQLPLPPIPGIPSPGSPPIPSDQKVADPESLIFPPNPLQPPSLIPNPLQPPPPLIPNPLQPPPLIPNPLRPPSPPPLIPNPFQPPSPPPLIPNPFQPPPSSGPAPLFPSPLAPGLISPSPPPPFLPFPFPPFFPPPSSPGTPPASSSSSSKNTSP